MEYFLKKPDGFQEVLRKGCMNKYEEKFKKVIASKAKSLQAREIAIKHLEISIVSTQELLKNLQGSASGAVALQNNPKLFSDCHRIIPNPAQDFSRNFLPLLSVPPKYS